MRNAGGVIVVDYYNLVTEILLHNNNGIYLSSMQIQCRPIQYTIYIIMHKTRCALMCLQSELENTAIVIGQNLWKIANGLFEKPELGNFDQVKCKWKLATFDAKRCQLSSVASVSHWAYSCTFAATQCVARVCQRQLILVWVCRQTWQSESILQQIA